MFQVPGPGIETASAPPKSVLSSSVETEGHLRSWPPEHSLHSPAFFPSKCSSVTNCLSIGHEEKGYVNLQAEIENIGLHSSSLFSLLDI